MQRHERESLGGRPGRGGGEVRSREGGTYAALGRRTGSSVPLLSGPGVAGQEAPLALRRTMGMLPILFEMETSDPDDFLTLLWLADHPDVELLGVLVTPGSRDQCQLVRWGLDACGRGDVPIGALHGAAFWETAAGQRPRVSGFHYKVYGDAILGHPVGEVHPGPALLAARLRARPGITVLVGSPPKTTGRALRDDPDLRLPRWVQQGGFAGDNLVAAPLDKFRGRLTCPSFNPGGAPKETLHLLASDQVGARVFVSKNVCHGVVWTGALQADLKARIGAGPRPGLSWMVHGLDRYLADKGVGKAMHDLVAAACAIDESVCDLRAVEIYREGGEWGARQGAAPNARISIGFSAPRFADVIAR